MSNMDVGQQELIRTAVNNATRDVERENRRLFLQLHEQAQETDMLRAQAEQYKRDFTSLNDNLSEHREQIRIPIMTNHELENQIHRASSTIHSNSAQIQALERDLFIKDDKILELERDLDVIPRQRSHEIAQLKTENADEDTRIEQLQPEYAIRIEALVNQIAELEISGNRHREELQESQNILSNVLNDNTFLREQLDDTAISAGDLVKKRKKAQRRAHLGPDGPDPLVTKLAVSSVCSY